MMNGIHLVKSEELKGRKYGSHKRNAVSPEYVSSFNRLVSEAYSISSKQVPY